MTYRLNKTGVQLVNGTQLTYSLFTDFSLVSTWRWTSQVALVVKNPSTNAEDGRDASSIPGLGRAPGGGHGNPLKYSCLDNPMDSGAWWATVHRVAESRTQRKWLSTLHGDISFCFSSISSSYQSSTKNKLDAQEQRLNCSRKFKYELSVKQYFLGICTKVNKNLTQNI